MKATFLLAALLVAPAVAAINIPGANATSGVLDITADTTIDLSLAADGAWDGANTAHGIYDADEWAVVFNYSSVHIASGTTLTFTNHPSRAPVVWLVSGDVTIDGVVSLDGQESLNAPLLAEPGPGGFRGATGYYSAGVGDSAGFGMGGGLRQAKGGDFGIGDRSYGNPSLVPLIGGSGGSAAAGTRVQGGGGGGGAILIACTGTLTVNGTLRANGGDGIPYYFSDRTGGGSGGGIRLVCSDFGGTGTVNALGGLGGQSEAATYGRIRLERITDTSAGVLSPDPSVVPLSESDTALVWPPPTAPEVRIVSIGGEAAPADPRASFGAAGADVSLAETSSTPIVIETTHVEQASTVEVRVTPRADGDAIIVPAAVDSVISTDPLVVQWTATLPVNTGYSAVQVKVIRP
ncbi:hypothetical protein [Haloferula sargassicola]|uniref:Uncharacterized protein n=1 Tax=Haloferula sargassicola TaxID=490096 RepID=A0ABP9UP26_9BACT